MYSKGSVVRTGILFSFINFAITAGLGCLLRYHVLFPQEWLNVRFWIHAHSHVGFLGWIFTALATLGYAVILPDRKRLNRQMFWLLVLAQLAVMGMLFTFPQMGYALYSIVFSTAHLVLSVVYAWWFYRYAPTSGLEVRLYKAALVFMMVSSLGPLALGPIMAFGYKETPLYDMAIYFYLHFQYNGWFTLAIFGLMVRLAKDRKLVIRKNRGKLFYRLMLYATILTLALSALGFGDNYYVLVVGGTGAILQLWAGSLILDLLRDKSARLFGKSGAWVTVLMVVAIASWMFKIILQFVSALPLVTDFAYANREAIMYYLHLTFLGFASCFIVGLLIRKNILKIDGAVSKSALVLFLVSIMAMLLAIGLKSFPLLLNFETLRMLNWSLLSSAIGVFASILILLFVSFGHSVPEAKHLRS
ncbi:MAG: hypothetical protein HC819_13055 [Cyclobacteriaceae bacterium]|nr:hypothetical protein [Cyclobacteriaceae bacterium]